MDFVNRLRSQNIFGNAKPLGMPDLSVGNTIDPWTLLKHLEGMRNTEMVNAQNQAEFERGRESNAQGAAEFNAKNPMNAIAQSIASGAAPSMQGSGMKTAFNPIPAGAITPYQQAQLSLEREKMNRRTAVDQAKLAIDEYKAKNPGMRVIATKGGNVQMYNPATGQVVDTGISTGEMTDAQLEEIRGERAMKEINRRGEIEDKQIERRGEIESRQIKERGEETRKSEIAKGTTATQDKAGIINRANQYRTQHPELANSIKIDPESGEIIITNDVDPIARARINEFIFQPKDIAIPSGGNDNTIQMLTPDGRPIQVPANQVEEAKKRGAKIVGQPNQEVGDKIVTSAISPDPRRMTDILDSLRSGAFGSR